jgi:MFS superfamily sulfate permease-like transporter
MSYASIAGVPAVFGLYGAFLPLVVYAMLGSSKQLGVGPVAVTSLLIGNGVKNMLPGSENIANPSKPEPQYVELQDTYNRKVRALHRQRAAVCCVCVCVFVAGRVWVALCSARFCSRVLPPRARWRVGTAVTPTRAPRCHAPTPRARGRSSSCASSWR